MKIINLYIAGRIFRGVLLAFIIVTSIIMLVDFVETSRNISSDDNISPLTILYLTLLKAPILIEQTVPFVVLFGVMTALYSLNRRSELTVLRASGLSAWRFLLPAISVTALLGIMWATFLNPLSVKAMDLHNQVLREQGTNTLGKLRDSEIWLREGTEFEQTVIYAPESDIYKRTLYKPTFTIFEADQRGDLIFKYRFDAKEAVLLGSNYWQLSEVYENTSTGQMQYNTAMSWPTTITLEQLNSHNKRDGFPPFWELPGNIKNLDNAGFSTVTYRLQLHKLLSLPLTLIAMTIIAAGVSMHLTRQGGTLRLMFAGAVIGFTVFFIENIIRAFGEAGSIPIRLAVWSIPIFVLLCGIAYLSRIEDG